MAGIDQILKPRPGKTVSQQHASKYCSNCDATSLHQRDVADTPHVLYFVLTWFTCWMFLPIWILAHVFRSKGPWLCSACGHEEGEYSDREADEDWRRKKRAERKRQAEREQLAKEQEQHRQERAEEKARRLAEQNSPERIAEREAKARARREALSSAKDTAVAQVGAAFQLVDRGLKHAAGDDSFMHNFFRVLTGLAMLVLAGVVLITLANLAGLA
jgi:uncharacterized Zn finger protein (UPF0148 family)